MANNASPRDLDHFPEDMPFQRRQWMFERVSWAVMAIVLILATLGFAGPGPLSHRSVSTSDGNLRVEYHRFIRYQTSYEVEIHLRQNGGQPSVSIARDYLKEVEVQFINPQPLAVSGDAEWITYTFAGADVQAIFTFESQRFGPSKLKLKTGDQKTLELKQFVFP
jgi:hypothetical protein